MSDNVQHTNPHQDLSSSRRPPRLHVVSDLHLDCATWTPPNPIDCDAIIVAGDTVPHPLQAVLQLETMFANWNAPVIMVCGNHEFYGYEIVDSLRTARDVAWAGGTVHLLENQWFDLTGPNLVLTRFFGATLWTDYQLDGDRRKAMNYAARGMADHAAIRTASGPFTPADALGRHEFSRSWLGTAMAETFDGFKVVVSHHAPHPTRLDPAYEHDPLNPAFASDLTEVIVRSRPDLWIHGHVHRASDATVEVDEDGAAHAVRFISNPRGYPHERTGFDPRCIVSPGA